MDEEKIARGVEAVRDAKHVGVDAWMEAAAAEFCFRGAGRPHGTKAEVGDYLACGLTPGHDGDCIFANASLLEDRLITLKGIRP